MSNRKQRESQSADESEDTAVLPQLKVTDSGEIEVTNIDRGSETDAWTLDSTAQHVIANEAEIGSLRSDLASMAESRGQLEGNLRGLTTNLRELEERLLEKSEQLANVERDRRSRESRIADLEIELAGVRSRLESELAETRANAAVEIGDARTEAASDLAEVRTQAEVEAAEIHGKLAATEELRRSLQERVDQQLAELRAFEQTRQRDAEALAEMQRAHGAHGDAMGYAQSRIVELEERSKRQHEVLQNMQSQRQLFEAMISEREQEIDHRGSAGEALEARLAELRRQSEQREAQHQTAIEEQRSRAVSAEKHLGEAQASIARLERQVADLSKTGAAEQAAATTRAAELQESMDAAAAAAQKHGEELLVKSRAAQQRGDEMEQGLKSARAENAALTAQQAATNQALAKVRDDLHNQGEALRVLQEQLESTRLRAEASAADLTVAEERIHAAEGELRQRDQRLEKFAATEAELRAELFTLTHSLAERDGLISRLEGETASSAAVLGKIQRNLARLDQGQSALTAQEQQVTRLLVRNKGGTEIVQVLGRRTLIGRGTDCQLQIDADFVSRRHAMLTVTGDSAVVEDLKSTNGVFINGNRISRRALNEGDELTIGKTRFRYQVRLANANERTE